MDGLETEISLFIGQDLSRLLPDLSVVIISYKVKQELRKCLSGLSCQDNFLEVIIADNNSDDGTLEMLKTVFPQIKLICNRYNFGFARAANQGIAASRGKYVLLLNPDTEVRLSALKEMVNFLDSNRGVGVLGCQIVNSDGQRQHSARSFPGFRTAVSGQYSLLNRIFPRNPWSKKYLGKELKLDKPTEADWVSGSCMLVRQEVFRKIGYLDNKFFMFVEDVDFCWRAKSAGWKIIYYPMVRIVHDAGQSVRQKKIKMLAEHHKSMYYYYLKYYGSTKLTKFLVFLGIWLRLGTATLGHWLKN